MMSNDLSSPSLTLIHEVDEAIRAIQKLKEPKALTFMVKSASLMEDVIRLGGKILIAGNGGSLCDAMHFVEELTGQFRKRRPAIAAVALADPGHMSCVANDMGFDQVFARGIEALGKPGDLFVILTTSGNSPNLVLAIEEAKRRHMHTIAFLGKDGGKLKGKADLEWIVDGFYTSDRIQEAHMAAIHIMIEQLEELLFYKEDSKGTVQEELRGVSAKEQGESSSAIHVSSAT